MEARLRRVLIDWFHEIEGWAGNHGLSVAELRALWEEVTPPPPDDSGTPLPEPSLEERLRRLEALVLGSRLFRGAARGHEM
jgi:hypothetical protein